jgi:hypothetical protein
MTRELETLNAVLLDGAEVTEAAKLLLEGVVCSLNSHNVPGLLELKLVGLYCAPQRYSLPVNMYEIYGNVLEIFDFSTDRYGPNLPP